MEFITPIGRIVQGSLWKPNTTDKEGRPLTYKDGSPRIKYYIGLAIAKTDPAFAVLWQQVEQVARSFWPGGQTQLAEFAWKRMDGDKPEYAQKEGFPGHWILGLTNGFPFKVYNKTLDAVFTDETQVKRGDYITVIGNVTSNKSDSKPGIFLNMKGVQFQAYGTEIVGVDYAAKFKEASPSALPAGASETPIAGGLPPAMPPQATPPAMPPQATPPAMPPQATPPAMPPQATPPPAPNFANPMYQMTEKAGGFSYEQMVEQGWSHEQLIAHGYVVA